MVGGVLLETVCVGSVAAVSIQRNVEIGELCSGRESSAVDVGVNGVDVRAGIDVDDRARQRTVLEKFEFESRPALWAKESEATARHHRQYSLQERGESKQGCPNTFIYRKAAT